MRGQQRCHRDGSRPGSVSPVADPLRRVGDMKPLLSRFPRGGRRRPAPTRHRWCASGAAGVKDGTHRAASGEVLSPAVIEQAITKVPVGLKPSARRRKLEVAAKREIGHWRSNSARRGDGEQGRRLGPRAPPAAAGEEPAPRGAPERGPAPRATSLSRKPPPVRY
jgi:hypothetical protein